MFDIVLYEPEIPPNTGNILRLSANTGCRLHLVRPLGFRLDDRSLRRSGLDYGDMAQVRVHADWPECAHSLAGRRLFAITTRGTTNYDTLAFAAGDVFLFGPETRGLPDTVLQAFSAQNRVRIPMREGSRSLNLSNAVAVIVYEAWRQLRFSGG